MKVCLLKPIPNNVFLANIVDDPWLEKYDAVIIGAGVAGLYLAYELGKRGFNAALVESKERSSIGEKTCGDAIGVHHFQELGLNPPQDVIDHKYRGVRIYAPDEKHYLDAIGEGISINRLRFGQWLLKLVLDSNVELLDNHIFVGLSIDKGYVQEIYVREKNSIVSKTIKSAVYVDASGVQSVLRRKLPTDWIINDKILKSDFNITYREVIELDKPLDIDNDYANIYLNKDIATGGYWWVFPKNRDGTVINVGLGIIWSLNVNPKILFYKYIKPRFKGRVVHAGGGLVPTRRPLPTLVWRNVLVTGDAAYTVNPLHGGGIGSSMLASHILAKHLVETFSTNSVNEYTMWSANIEYMDRYGAKQASLDVIRLFLQVLDNNDLLWIIEKQLVSSSEVYDLSYKGGLSDKIVKRFSLFIKTLSKPSLLDKLIHVKKYMDTLMELYTTKYPASPNDLIRWIIDVDNVILDFKEKISYPY